MAIGLPFRQAHQFSEDRLIETASYLLLCGKVPAVHGIRHLPKLLNQLISRYVVPASIG